MINDDIYQITDVVNYERTYNTMKLLFFVSFGGCRILKK